MLDLVASYCRIQFQGKPRIQARENAKNFHFGHDLVHWAQIRAANFFFKNLALSVTTYHGQLSSCTISEKMNDSPLRKFSGGQADG